MKILLSEKGMILLLWLIALHSFMVGLLLMFLPPDIMQIFGYNLVNEPFFQIQAGIFHLVMVVAYLMAAKAPGKRQIMVIFAYRVKFIATLFLLCYFIFMQSIVTVFLSGLGDFAMALVLLFLHRFLLKEGLYNE